MCALAMDEIETVDDLNTRGLRRPPGTAATADAPSQDLFAGLSLTETCARQRCESSICGRRLPLARSFPRGEASCFGVCPQGLCRYRRASTVPRGRAGASHATRTGGPARSG